MCLRSIETCGWVPRRGIVAGRTGVVGDRLTVLNPLTALQNQDRTLPREEPRQAQRETNIRGLVRDTHSSGRVQLPSRVQQKGASEIDDSDVAAVLVFRDLLEGDFNEGAERISEPLPDHGTENAGHKASAVIAIVEDPRHDPDPPISLQRPLCHKPERGPRPAAAEIFRSRG